MIGVNYPISDSFNKTYFLLLLLFLCYATVSFSFYSPPSPSHSFPAIILFFLNLTTLLYANCKSMFLSSVSPYIAFIFQLVGFCLLSASPSSSLAWLENAPHLQYLMRLCSWISRLHSLLVHVNDSVKNLRVLTSCSLSVFNYRSFGSEKWTLTKSRALLTKVQDYLQKKIFLFSVRCSTCRHTVLYHEEISWMSFD